MSGTDSAGRFNILSQMEHLQSKYMGTGHADTTKFEWATHQHRWESNFRTRNQPRCHFSRDTFASLMGHTDLTNHLAICENESKARVRFQMLEKMLQPCGPPPEKKSEDWGALIIVMVFFVSSLCNDFREKLWAPLVARGQSQRQA